ncbi:MAG: PadR family transcriptional regulator [Methanobacterium sp.]|uniref:PadR family transcriptional regulator n=1 Tax=Methanobacterium sp. TaxID=2164 RepID=UPI003D64DD76|nr:PadR family transcriptional regulator [Methanobacterium sp.]
MDDSNGYGLKSGVNTEIGHKHMEKHTEICISLSKFEKKLIRGLIRSFSNIMILWLISKKRLHGYEIMTKLHESTPYESKMPSASKIYPVLHDLEKNGLIKGSWEHQGKRKVKYYEITDEGEECLQRFRKLAKHAKYSHASIGIEFMEDMNSVKYPNE